jgi:hypothetical protein
VGLSTFEIHRQWIFAASQRQITHLEKNYDWQLLGEVCNKLALAPRMESVNQPARQPAGLDRRGCNRLGSKHGCEHAAIAGVLAGDPFPEAENAPAAASG